MEPNKDQLNGLLNQAMWDAITSVPGVGIALLDQDGRILFANREINRILRGEDASDPTGKRLDDVFPPEYVRERMDILHGVTDSRKPALLRHITNGVQVESALYPIVQPSGEVFVLTVTRQGASAVENDSFQVVESDYADFGPLDVLSPRELEVLALLGKGMQIAEIAGALYRSPKTVEKHRAAISRKLGVASRAELARIAHDAGLEPEDAKRKRYKLAG